MSSSLSSSGVQVPGVSVLRHHEERWLAAVAAGDEHATRRAWLAPLAERVLEAGLEHLMQHGPEELVEELLPLLPASLDWNRLVTKALATGHTEVLPFWLPRCDLLSPSCRIIQEAVAQNDRPVVRAVLEQFVAQASGTSPVHTMDWRSLLSVAGLWATERHQDALVQALLVFDDDGRLADRLFKQAVHQGHVPLVKQLQAGRGLATCQAALFTAVEDGKTDMVAHLLPHVHLAVHPINLLAPAVRNGHEAVVRLLVPHLDPHLFNSDAIGLAVETQATTILACLLEHAHPDRLPVGKIHQAARHGCDLLLDWIWPHVGDPAQRQRVMLSALEDGHHDQVVKRLPEEEVLALGQVLVAKRAWGHLDSLASHVPAVHATVWIQAVPAEVRDKLPNLHARHLAHARAQVAVEAPSETTRHRRRP